MGAFSGKTFEVRPFELNDVRLLSSWMAVSEYELFLLSSTLIFPVAPETLTEYFQKSAPESHRFYSVFWIETGEHVGHFEIKNINLKHKAGTGAHLILSPTKPGRGLGRLFVDLVSKTGFEDLKLHRVSLSVHTVNISAIVAYLKAGYFFEGTIRDVLVYKGMRYSLYQMSLLKKEWKSMAAK